MKTLILAFVCFGLVLLGSHDVKPFKAIRRVLRRTPAKTGTGQLRRTGPLPTAPRAAGYPEYPEYPARRRHS